MAITVHATPDPLPTPGVYTWHFLSASGHMRAYRDGDPRKGRLVKPGQTYHVNGPIACCMNGLHASVNACDALKYAPGAFVQRCWSSGEMAAQNDKLASADRACLWVADASDTLHLFAAWTAEKALLAEREAGREPHQASWEAVSVKRRWVAKDATDAELHAAAHAAYDAYDAANAAAAAYDAYDAAYAANAAYAAANAAANAAATAADYAAAYAAYAAHAADYAAAQNVQLTAMLMALAPAGYVE